MKDEKIRQKCIISNSILKFIEEIKPKTKKARTENQSYKYLSYFNHPKRHSQQSFYGTRQKWDVYTFHTLIVQSDTANSTSMGHAGDGMSKILISTLYKIQSVVIS